MRKGEDKTRDFAKDLRKNSTKAETILWKYLKNSALQNVKFRRQHPIPPFIADFASLEIKLIIEIDGATHSTKEELKSDLLRTKFLESKGWEVLRYRNFDIYENINNVVNYIEMRIYELKMSKNPPPSATLTPPP